MRVMPPNNSKAEVHYWQGAYGGLGHLYAPGGERGPYRHLPYALDNGAYGAFVNDEEWDAAAFCALLEWARASEIDPLWVVVPDEVAEPEITLARWEEWAPRLQAEYGWDLALAVQDGMTPHDIEGLSVEPSLVFVGGSTEWKWTSLPRWCEAVDRVHVGRCNSPDRLYLCSELGVESVDGTGWFRGTMSQTRGLERFLMEQARDELYNRGRYAAPLFQ